MFLRYKYAVPDSTGAFGSAHLLAAIEDTHSSTDSWDGGPAASDGAEPATAWYD